MNDKELERIYNESYKAVYWTAISLLKNEEDAEDVVQDTFVTLIEAYDDIKDKTKVQAWLKRTAANKSLNKITRTRTVNAEDEFLEEIEAVPDDFLPDSLVESEESRKIIMDIINNSLSEEIRKTLILYYFDEMTAKEISAALDVPQGTVLWRLNYAKKKIKTEVAKYEDENDTKLFALALPFLCKLFNAEASRVTLKPISPNLTKLTVSNPLENKPKPTEGKPKVGKPTEGKPMRSVNKMAGRVMSSATTKTAALGVIAAVVTVAIVSVVKYGSSKNKNAGVQLKYPVEVTSVEGNEISVRGSVVSAAEPASDSSYDTYLTDNEFYRLEVLSCEYHDGHISYSVECLNKTQDTDMRVNISDIRINRWILQNDGEECFYWNEILIPKGTSKVCSFDIDCMSLNNDIPEEVFDFMDCFSCCNTVTSEEYYQETNETGHSDIDNASYIFTMGEITERVNSTGLPQNLLVDNEYLSVSILDVTELSSGVGVTMFIDSKGALCRSSYVVWTQDVYENYAKTMVAGCSLDSKQIIRFTMDKYSFSESGTADNVMADFQIIITEGVENEIFRETCSFPLK